MANGRPSRLARHLMRTDHNDRVLILDIWGLNARNVAEALQELHDLGAAAATGRTMYHGIITPRAHEQLTEDQRRIAVARYAKKMGLQDQPYIVVEHTKAGRAHYHVIWSRIDLDHMRGISDSHNYRKHEELSRELEIEFGHELTIGAHVRDKTRVARPGRTPSHADMQQAQRTGMTVGQAKQLVTEAWKRTRTGAEFAEALEQEGFLLTHGERRDFVLIDREGGLHSLGRRLDGVKAAEVRERLIDIDPKELPDIAEAKARMRELRRLAALEQEQERLTTDERRKAEDQRREREARQGTQPGTPWRPLTHTDQEIIAAVWQLERTGTVTHVQGRPGALPRSAAPALQPPQPERRIEPERPPPPPTAAPPQRETMMQRLERESRERGDAALKIAVETPREHDLKLELERPTRKPGWRPGDP